MYLSIIQVRTVNKVRLNSKDTRKIYPDEIFGTLCSNTTNTQLCQASCERDNMTNKLQVDNTDTTLFKN